MMKRIYIAGKITGLSRSDYAMRFLHAENMLVEKFEIVNPIFLERLNLDDSLHRDAIMEICKVLISTCDAETMKELKDVVSRTESLVREIIDKLSRFNKELEIDKEDVPI